MGPRALTIGLALVTGIALLGCNSGSTDMKELRNELPKPKEGSPSFKMPANMKVLGKDSLTPPSGSAAGKEVQGAPTKGGK